MYDAKKDSHLKKVTIPCNRCSKQTHRKDAKYCTNCGLKLEFFRLDNT